MGPLGVQVAPDMFATSWTGIPTATLRAALVAFCFVVMAGGMQLLKLPPVKSLSVAVSCAEEGVSAWKKAEHGTDPPRPAVRSTPASTRGWVWWPEALPADQGASAARR